MKTIKYLTPLFKCAIFLSCSITSCDQRPQAEAKQNLAVAFDKAGFTSFEMGELDFFTSCFALEDVLQRKIIEWDIPDARHIAKDLRVVVATGRNGQFGIPLSKGALSIREAITAFASVWDVVVLVDGNTLIIAEPFDVDRFLHSIAIKPKSGFSPPAPTGGDK